MFPEVIKFTALIVIYFAATSFKGGSRAAATSKMERFVIIVNYYHKALHLGCCSSPRSAFETCSSKIDNNKGSEFDYLRKHIYLK